MQITIRYEEDDIRPKKGWRIYNHLHGILSPCVSQRRDRIKYIRLHDALRWASENRPGYTVNIRVKCYSGVLEQTGISKEEDIEI